MVIQVTSIELQTFINKWKRSSAIISSVVCHILTLQEKSTKSNFRVQCPVPVVGRAKKDLLPSE